MNSSTILSTLLVRSGTGGMDSLLRSSSDVADSFEKEYTIEFHGYVAALPCHFFKLDIYRSTTYVLTVFATDSLLRIDIELVDTCDRWCGEFTSQRTLHEFFVVCDDVDTGCRYRRN